MLETLRFLFIFINILATSHIICKTGIILSNSVKSTMVNKVWMNFILQILK